MASETNANSILHFVQFRSLNSGFSVYTELPLEYYRHVLLIKVVTPGVKLIDSDS